MRFSLELYRLNLKLCDGQVVLAIGMKLQHIVATLALETSPNGAVPGHFVGALLKPRDQLFWFNRPKLLLHVIHLVLFQVRLHFEEPVAHHH